ncbi:MAG: DUF2628 domain-containing protein [Ruminococcus sp.]|nr:DUF2628 domain-containing protein [Ruminococcus sp.]
MDLIGESCVVCKKVFEDGDDIVVCPDCGSPHHRACYKEIGHCGNQELHSQGGVWQRKLPKTPLRMPTDDTVCPVCRSSNKSGADVCSHCGARLLTDKPVNNMEGTSAQYLGFDPDEDMGGATLKEVSDFVAVNTIYYIPIFKRIKDYGMKVSLNISCFLFPPLYFANRRMWLWTIISSLIMVVLALPAAISMLVGDALENGANIFSISLAEYVYANRTFLNGLTKVFNAADVVIRTAFCLFGNYLYFRFALRQLRRMKKGRRIGAPPSEVISAAGGVRPLNMLLSFLLLGVMSIAGMYGSIIFIELLRLMFTA